MILYVGFLCFPYAVLRVLLDFVAHVLAILCIAAGGLVLGATTVMRWCDRQTDAIMREHLDGKN